VSAPSTPLRTGPGVSDHALLRFLERAGGLDVEELRARLANSLARAHRAALTLDAVNYVIKADGLVYVVRGETVTTVLEERAGYTAARAMRNW